MNRQGGGGKRGGRQVSQNVNSEISEKYDYMMFLFLTMLF